MSLSSALGPKEYRTESITTAVSLVLTPRVPTPMIPAMISTSRVVVAIEEWVLAAGLAVGIAAVPAAGLAVGFSAGLSADRSTGLATGFSVGLSAGTSTVISTGLAVVNAAANALCVTAVNVIP